MPIACEKKLEPAREYASARFSSIVILGAVPFIGSWKTLPTSLALLCSGIKEISLPSSIILPLSCSNVPHIILKSVDLPAPFEPTIVTNSPSLSVRLMLFNALCSLTVSFAKVLETFLISSIFSCLLLCFCIFNFVLNFRNNECCRHNYCTSKLHKVFTVLAKERNVNNKCNYNLINN